MFTFYLLGLCFWPPWRDQCNKPATYMVHLNVNNFINEIKLLVITSFFYFSS